MEWTDGTRARAGRLFLLPVLWILLSPAALRAQEPGEVDARLGQWALEMRLGTVVRAPPFRTDRSETVYRFLVDLEAEDTGIMQRHRVCSVHANGTSGTRLRIPSTFAEAFSSRRYPVLLGHPEDPGWVYRANLGEESVGFDPIRSGGALPTRADHPAVTDADGDGAPGVTVEVHLPAVGEVRLHTVQRSHLVLSGRPTAPGRVEGDVEVLTLEQAVIGAEPGLFRRIVSLSPDPGASRFVLIRLSDDQETECEALPGVFEEEAVEEVETPDTSPADPGSTGSGRAP